VPGLSLALQFDKADDATSCKKHFTLDGRKWEACKSKRFYNGECARVVKWWLKRMDEDASGLIFEESNPTQDADASQLPVAMLINSSKLHAVGFKLKEVLAPQLEAAA